MVIFDWSDAAIAKPFVDVMTWATWLPHDPSARDALWQSFADVWADVLPPAAWLELRPTLEGIAGAYHVVSYAGIVRSLDRLRRPEHAGGLAEFFRFLDTACRTGRCQTQVCESARPRAQLSHAYARWTVDGTSGVSVVIHTAQVVDADRVVERRARRPPAGCTG